MTVSVLMPHREVEQKQVKETALDKLIKGVQVAQGMYGIYSDMSKLDAMKEQQDLARMRLKQQDDLAQKTFDLNAGKAKREEEAFNIDKGKLQASEAGIVTPGTLNTDYLQKGYALADRDGPGTVARTLKTPQGESTIYLKAPSQVLNERERIGQGAKLAEAGSKERVALSEDLNKFSVDQDKRVRDIVESADAARQVQWLLKQNAAVTDQIALRQVFRMSGDVGAIRPEDLKQLGASPAMKDQAMLALNKMASGQTIADAERANLNRFTDYIIQKRKSDIVSHADRYSKNLSVKYRGVNQEDILNALSPTSLIPEPVDVQRGGGGGGFRGPLAPQAYEPFDPDKYLSGR